jgi:hypothetical protein
MTENEAIAVIVEGLSGFDGLPTKIHGGRGLDRAQLALVRAAILHLIGAWKDRDTVPKSGAMAFVDIQTGLSSRFYSEDEQREMEDAGIELVELANRLFAAPNRLGGVWASEPE